MVFKRFNFFCYFLKKEIELFIKEAYQTRYQETLSDSTVSTIFTLITIAFVIGGMYHIFNFWHHFFSSSNCISFFIGGMIGGLSGGWLATKVGRKQGLLYNQILSFTGAILSGCAKPADSYEMLIIGESLVSRRRFFFKFKNLEYYFNVRSPWNRNCLWIIYWFGSFVYHRGGPCSSSWRFGNVQSIGSYFRNSVEVCGHFSFHTR